MRPVQEEIYVGAFLFTKFPPSVPYCHTTKVMIRKESIPPHPARHFLANKQKILERVKTE